MMFHSWTEDEDFNILLDALVTLDSVVDTDFPFTVVYLCFFYKAIFTFQLFLNACVFAPKTLKVVAVTGKGPLREHYRKKIATLKLRRFCVLTIWLSPADYPKLMVQWYT